MTILFMKKPPSILCRCQIPPAAASENTHRAGAHISPISLGIVREIGSMKIIRINAIKLAMRNLIIALAFSSMEMQDRTLPPSVLEIFRSHLQHAERSPSTIEKYLRSVRVFSCWLNGRTVTKDAVAAWKSHLVAQSYAPVTVNAALSALNSLFQYLGWEDCRVRFLKIQRRLFREPDRELDRSDYLRLIRTARQQGKNALPC